MVADLNKFGEIDYIKSLLMDNGVVTTGKIFFVNNSTTFIPGGVVGADTTSYGEFYWKPFSTIDFAINQCTANRGDVIVVLPGHAETIASAAAIALDTAGVTVFGVGHGDLRPTLTFATSAAASIAVTGADCKFVGAWKFVCNIASQNHMFDIAADDFEIDGLSKNGDYQMLFTEGSATGLAFITADTADGDSDNLKIRGCKFYAPTAGNYDAAIQLGKDFANVVVEHCEAYGDFDDACISIPAGGNAQVNCNLSNLKLTNLQSGQHAIEVNSTTSTGMISHVKCVTNAIGTSVDAGGLEMFDVLFNDGTDQSGWTAVAAEPDSTSNILGANDSNNDYDSSSVAPNKDGSVLERLEQIDQYVSGGSVSFGANPFLGTRVATATPTDIFDGTSDKALFTVSGGKVLLTCIWVEVSGAAVDGTNSNLTFSTNPTVGTDLTLSTNLDIISDEVGSIYSISAIGSATTGGSGGGANTLSAPIIIDVGTICIDTSADAGTGGALGSAVMYYWPIESGASVAAAF